MKTKYFKYLWFVVILGLFVFSMFTIRMKTKTDIQDRIYQKWEKHFVVKKGNEAYVKTTNDKDKDVVLSESQSYGMLITVRAAKKGLANQKDFERAAQCWLEATAFVTAQQPWVYQWLLSSRMAQLYSIGLGR